MPANSPADRRTGAYITDGVAISARPHARTYVIESAVDPLLGGLRALAPWRRVLDTEVGNESVKEPLGVAEQAALLDRAVQVNRSVQAPR